MWSVVGGSGFESFEDFRTIEELDGSTPFGPASSGLRRVKIGGEEILFLSRHGKHHEHLPSEVNYRANIYALKKHGATKIISVSAVGSLKQEYKPGDLVVPRQYIDRTKSLRQHSFCGEGIVGHVSLAHPTSGELTEKFKSLSAKFDFDVHFGATYICVEGPYFSTQAESKSYMQMGATIIGMTNFPEYALAREAGIAYLPCCFITDYDCWDDSIPHCTLEEIIKVMKGNNSKAFKAVKELVHEGQKLLPHGCPEQGLKTGLMVPWESIAEDKRKWLQTIIK